MPNLEKKALDNSDYNDMFVASIAETQQQIENAESVIHDVEVYLRKKGVSV